jgi:hypothetical protein
MAVLFLLFMIVWGGLWWRFRGGAFTTITGFDPGTGGMRAIAAVFMMIPLSLCSPVFLWLIPVMWISWSIAGWGAFQGMTGGPPEEKNWVCMALVKLGITGVTRDIIGMAIEGMITLLLPGIAFGIIVGSVPVGIGVTVAGIMFSPIYYAMSRSPWLPDWGKFAKADTEWAEVLVGCWVAAVFALIAMMP